MKDKIGYLPNGIEVKILEVLSNGYLVNNTYNKLIREDDGTFELSSEEYLYDDEPYFVKDVLTEPIYPKLNLDYSNKHNMLTSIQKEIAKSNTILSDLKRDINNFSKMDEWKIDLSKYANNDIFCFTLDSAMPVNFKKADGVRFTFTKTYYRGEKKSSTNIQISTYDTWNNKDIDMEYEIYFNIDDALAQVKDRIDKKINFGIVNDKALHYSFQHSLMCITDEYLSDFAKEYINELKIKKSAFDIENLEKQQTDIINKINAIKNEINQK